MKNIIAIAVILILPLIIYSIISKNSSDLSVYAKDNDKPSVMIFTSSMCMDCQKMKTIIKEVQPSYEGRMNFVQINATEKNRTVKELVKKYRVSLVPTLIFMNKEKKELKRVEGSIPKEELISDIEETING